MCLTKNIDLHEKYILDVAVVFVAILPSNDIVKTIALSETLMAYTPVLLI